MANDFIIRPARIDDAEGIFEAHRRSIQEVCAKDYTPEQIAGWFPNTRTPQNYADKISEGDKKYFVADINGVIVGFSNFENDGSISSCYIHPNYLRRGIATELFKATEAAIKELNIHKITLNSSKTAVKFYQSMGMSVAKEILHRLRSGVDVEAYQMEKTIK